MDIMSLLVFGIGLVVVVIDVRKRMAYETIFGLMLMVLSYLCLAIAFKNK